MLGYPRKARDGHASLQSPRTYRAVESTQIKWVSKEEASARLSLSPRRVLELAQEGRIQSAKARDPKTGQNVVRIHAGSVERYLDGLSEMPEPQECEAHADRTPARGPHANRTLLALLELVSETHAERTRSARPWLTLSEAAAYSGLPASTLRGFIVEGRLAALDVGSRRRGGRWRVRIIDLGTIEPVKLFMLPQTAL